MKERPGLLGVDSLKKSGVFVSSTKKLIIHDSGRTTTDAIETRQDVREITSPGLFCSRMKAFPPFC